jgi:hypothetical protein
VLFDLSNGRGHTGWHPILEAAHASGTPVVMYPHAARPMVQWDGILAPSPMTRCSFAHAPGGVEVLKRFGYPYPVEAAGWSLCPLRPFTPVERVRHIVYGPIHPNTNGWLHQDELSINRRAFERLRAYCRETGTKLTVRYLRGLVQNGLEKVEGVSYVQGRADQSTAEIDQADLVVGHQTFAYLAAARGKPTLMMAEDIPPRSGNRLELYRYVASWEKYGDYLAYPLDILATDGSVAATAALIERACAGDPAAAEWRARFIGQPFDGPAFVRTLESYL